MRNRCFSFMPSGHKFFPLDTTRLYCSVCGRITWATPDNNVLGWDIAYLQENGVAVYRPSFGEGILERPRDPTKFDA